jgi:hypothetical protein
MGLQRLLNICIEVIDSNDVVSDLMRFETLTPVLWMSLCSNILLHTNMYQRFWTNMQLPSLEQKKISIHMLPKRRYLCTKLQGVPSVKFQSKFVFLISVY